MLKLEHVHQFLIIIIFFFFFISLSHLTAAADLICKNGQSIISRRILHQPLFPATSSPPPELDPPPPPPPPSDATFPNPDQPFFPEVPTTPTPPDQSRSTVSPPPRNETVAANPIAAQPTKPVKKYAIVLSVAIVSLGMLSALAFYIYKHKSRHHQMETIKLVAPNFRDESRFQQPPPPSNFLYIGTVEPTRPTMTNENHNAIGSPYRKLKPDRYRPSPELQPLPPLTKPPVPAIDSPPPMSSSDDDDDDDEAHDQTAFYTPNDSSSTSIGEISHNSSSRRSYNSSRWTSKIKLEDEKTNTFPKSKRTSPKSRLSNSSPDSKQRLPTPSSPPVAEIRPFSRPKFSPPLPAPNMALLRSNISQSDQIPKTQIPPPPPPPPPMQIPSLTPRKLKPLKRESPISFPDMGSKPSIMKPISVELKERTTEEIKKRTDYDEEEEGERPKLKALHWDKVRATSDRATVWDQLKSSSFKLNEDMMESLFGCKSANPTPKETATTTTTARRLVMPPPPEQENRVLDPKKSQNIAILLRALNVTRDEVSEALLVGNPEGLGVELLETLVKMAPTKEEEIKLRDYSGDLSKLGSAERFLKCILDIPFAFKRVEAMLYRANFEAEVKYLRNSFQTLEIASEELKNSRLFLKLLEAVLQTGNRMNVGTNRGDAKAFKLETLLKLVDIKGTDGKTTLLHFVVQEIIRSEGVISDSSTNKQNSSPIKITMTEEDFKKQGLRVVSGLSKELANVKQAAGMDSDVLNSYLMKLETGLVKVRKMVMENEKQGGRFFDSMKAFMEQEADNEIKRIKAEEKKALLVVKDVTEYFHGDKGKVEAHPLRIFMIVRDFLSILDNVCKEVRVLQDNAVMGSARSFRLHPTASLPVLNRYNVKQGESSDEDDQNSLSP